MHYPNTPYAGLLQQAPSTLNTNSSQVFCRLGHKMTEFIIHSSTTILTLVKVLDSNTLQNSFLKQLII